MVGGRTGSAADLLAYIYKQSGFATLVGTNTCSQGLNGECGPQAMPLPNSGLLITFAIFYGLNPDGTCHDEFDTATDIYTEEGKTALETRLN